jgi:hypothetical protein
MSRLRQRQQLGTQRSFFRLLEPFRLDFRLDVPHRRAKIDGTADRRTTSRLFIPSIAFIAADKRERYCGYGLELTSPTKRYDECCVQEGNVTRYIYLGLSKWSECPVCVTMNPLLYGSLSRIRLTVVHDT